MDAAVRVLCIPAVHLPQRLLSVYRLVVHVLFILHMPVTIECMIHLCWMSMSLSCAGVDPKGKLSVCLSVWPC